MDFLEYLKSKKIDPGKFNRAEPELFGDFKQLFDQVHPNSFTAQKLFLINDIRRKYKWVEDAGEKKETPVKKVKPKMVMKPRPKMK